MIALVRIAFLCIALPAVMAVRAESGIGEILEIKQSSTGGENRDHDATLLARLDEFSRRDTQCSSDGSSTMKLSADRAMYQQMMGIALAALMSGRRVRLWFHVTPVACDIYAIAIKG